MKQTTSRAASLEISEALSCSVNSFTAGTPVLMADGTQKPIEDVEVGDEVLATDPQTGQSGAREVTDLIRHGGGHTMVDVTLDDGTVIEATDEHPFWSANRGEFVFAIDLKVGEQMLGADGDLLTVTATVVYVEDLTAYNLAIEGIHTYYVGETPAALGLKNQGLQQRADLLGSKTLLKEDDFRAALQSAGQNPKQTFSFMLNGLTGNSIYSQVMSGVQGAAVGAGGATDWELGLLHAAGRLPEVRFFLGGVRVANPF